MAKGGASVFDIRLTFAQLKVECCVGRELRTKGIRFRDYNLSRKCVCFRLHTGSLRIMEYKGVSGPGLPVKDEGIVHIGSGPRVGEKFALRADLEAFHKPTSAAILYFSFLKKV